MELGSGGSYTSEAVAYDGTVGNFTVTASDAGAGFTSTGLSALNLLTFGLLGFAGPHLTVTVPVNVAAWKRSTPHRRPR